MQLLIEGNLIVDALRIGEVARIATVRLFMLLSVIVLSACATALQQLPGGQLPLPGGSAAGVALGILQKATQLPGIPAPVPQIATQGGGGAAVRILPENELGFNDDFSQYQVGQTLLIAAPQRYGAFGANSSDYSFATIEETQDARGNVIKALKLDTGAYITTGSERSHDYRVGFDFKSHNGGGLYLVLNLSQGGHYFHTIYLQSHNRSGDVMLEKWVGDQHTTLVKREGLGFTFGQDRWNRIQLENAHGRIKIILDGQVLLDYVNTDPSYSHGGLGLQTSYYPAYITNLYPVLFDAPATPQGASFDRDGDKTANADDLCPDQPEDYNGIEDSDGCPDADADGDGIIGQADFCPNEPEDKNGVLDDDGCPDKLQVVIRGKQILTLKEIEFDFDSASLRPSSHALLDQVIERMRAFPKGTRFLVEGHTDEEGTDDYNQTLSERRAIAVVDYLSSKRVSRDLLIPVGAGEKRPIAENNTERGRQRNRRVEFTVVESREH